MLVAGAAGVTDTGGRVGAPAEPVTIKGMVLNHVHTGETQRSVFVYALDGPPQIRSEFEHIMAEYYPERGLDGDAARALLAQFTARLKYFVDGPMADKLEQDATYNARRVMAVSGVITEREGRKWITVTGWERVSDGTSELDRQDTVDPQHIPPQDRGSAGPAAKHGHLGKGNAGYALGEVEYISSDPSPPGAYPGVLRFRLAVEGQLDKDRPGPKPQPLTNLVFIPPGTFRMGSPTNEADRQENEGPQRTVTISRGFWMGKYPVTQGEYQAVMGSNPSHFTSSHGYAQDLGRPVEQVNWFDATEYCRRLTQRERAAGRIAASTVFRLPAEAEWEYACRAGTLTRFSYGEDPAYRHLADYGWYQANSGGATHPVGQKLPNPWGLHEMHGHVFEWCQDLYGPYPGGKTAGTTRPNQLRVFRGGLWDGSAKYCRSASRGHSVPGSRSFYVGFRVVLAPGP